MDAAVHRSCRKGSLLFFSNLCVWVAISNTVAISAKNGKIKCRMVTDLDDDEIPFFFSPKNALFWFPLFYSGLVKTRLQQSKAETK